MKTTTAILWALLIGSTIFLATTGHLRWLAPLTLATIGLGVTAYKQRLQKD